MNLPTAAKSHAVAVLLAQLCAMNVELAKASGNDELWATIVEQRDIIISLIESVQNDVEVRANKEQRITGKTPVSTEAAKYLTHIEN